MRAKAHSGALHEGWLVPLTSAHWTALPVRVERVGAGDGAVHGRAGHRTQLQDTENTEGPLFWGADGSLVKDTSHSR